MNIQRHPQDGLYLKLICPPEVQVSCLKEPCDSNFDIATFPLELFKSNVVHDLNKHLKDEVSGRVFTK